MSAARASLRTTCVQCSASFFVDANDLIFLDRISPRFDGVTCTVPPPTHCPECRQQRRLALCNERFFYSGKCGLCDKSVLTEHPPHAEKTAYCRDCWHGDGWDPCSYGREVDFTRPIFDQLKELRFDVPAQNLLIEGTNLNSEYIHYAGFAKNCYLIMHADYCEDCYYGYGFKKNIACVDGFYNLGCELCYDCVDVHKSYGLIGCQDCTSCSSSFFLRDCIGCKNCFLCVGLRQKEYCFENEQLTKPQYQAKMKEIDLGSFRQYQQHKKHRKVLERHHTFKEYHGHNLENCSGDYIVNCKDTHASFDCEDVEGGKFLYQVVTGAKNDYDIYQYGLNLAESYECSVAGNNCHHILFSHNAHISCADLLYCWFVQSSRDCFGCISMHHKQYCVLNKQYTKDQYNKLVPRIIGHMTATKEWGELFPVSFSPFGYNKTSAALHFPLSEKQAAAKGWAWDNVPDTLRDVASTIKSEDLPDSIDEAPEEIVQSAVRCEVTGKLFRVTKQELAFYRKQRLPLPRRSPDQRHIDRFAQRNPRKFWARDCGKCGKEIRTTYAPEKEQLVYCEPCYLETVY